jgi:hypothetical protein
VTGDLPALPSYSVEKFNFDTDEHALLSFWAESDNYWGPERLDWLRRFNGFGFSETFVLRQKGCPAILGNNSAMLRSFMVNSSRIMGGISCDLLVHKGLRSFGPALKLMRGFAEGVENAQFLLACPNDRARPVLKRAGFAELGVFDRWVKILRSEPKLQSRIANRLFRKMVSGMVDAGLRSLGYRMALARLMAFGRTDIKASLNFIDFSPGEIDTPIFGERNLDFMNWRYCQMPGQRFYVHSVLRHGESIAYIVSSLSEENLTIEDILLCNQKLFTEAMVSFLRYAARLPVASISIGFFGNTHYERTLRKLGFIKREGRPLFIYLKNTDLETALLNKENWFLLHGDIDL